MTTPNSALAVLLTTHVVVDAENILKCLDAGFDTVLAVVPEVDDLLFLQIVAKRLGDRQGSVMFSTHDVAARWLERYTDASRGTTDVSYSRGYTVVSIYPPPSPETERRELEAIRLISSLLGREPESEC